MRFAQPVLLLLSAQRFVTCFPQCELIDNREVSTEDGQNLAKSFGVPFFESSAQRHINVEEPFFELVSRDVLLRGSLVFVPTSLTRSVSRSEKSGGTLALILKPI